MDRFRFGHGAHPDWREAAATAVAALTLPPDDPRTAGTEALGIVYATAAFTPHLGELLDWLRGSTGVSHWTGGVGLGVCCGPTEYDDEAAVVLMLADLPPASFRVFSGRHPIPDARGNAAIVHADPGTTDLPELLSELSERTDSGLLFGAIIGDTPGRGSQVADGVLAGGVSGAIFSSSVGLLSRVTQSCVALGEEHFVSGCTPNFLHSLDGRPALDVLLEDLEVAQPVRNSRRGEDILRALPTERLRGGLLVGLAGEGAPGPGFGDFLVRNVVGIDPLNRLVAIAGAANAGERAVFCTRDSEAARLDLIRICTELRGEVEDRDCVPLGAVYHSCSGRGAALFGASGAEAAIIRHNLGDIPLIGVYCNGEIQGDRIYGYTGVLTLFVRPNPASGDPS